MPTSIDSLQIEINANATKANDVVDKLCNNIDRLSNSFSRLNTSSLTELANGVQRLGTAMQSMNNVRTADFTRLANNIEKLGRIDVSALNSAASSMSHLTRAFNNLGTVSQNVQQVGTLADGLSRLGGASVQRAITNIPQLATALNGMMATLARSPRVSNNIIRMTNALVNLSSQGRSVGAATNALASGLQRTNRAMLTTSRSGWSLAASFGRFYANCFLLVRGIKGLWNSIKGTADYIEAFNYFNVAFGKVASEWNKDWEKYGYDNAESYANSFTERLSKSLGKLSGIQIDIESGLLRDTGMKNLGLNIQEITQYASQLASVTNSVGQTGEVSLVASNVFTKLGADISSLFNQDYSGAMKNLQSGLIGQSRALYKYGIDITNATLQTYAYGLGIEKAVSEMTQAEKMQLRMIAILEQSKVAWGDLANTINSPSNMIRQFTNNLKETGMVLGQLFIPLLEKVLPIINGVTIAIKRLLVNIAGFLGVKIDFSSFGQGYSDDIDGVTDSFDDATAAAKKLKTVTLGIDELNINNPQNDSGSGVGVGGGIDLTDEIIQAASEYEKVWDEAFAKMESRAQVFADKFEKFLEPIRNMFEDLSYGWYKTAGMDFSDIVIGINEALTNAIAKVDWEQVGRDIGEFLKGIKWGEVLSSFGKLFWEGVNAAIDTWKGMFSVAPIETSILTATLLTLPLIGPALGALKSSLPSLSAVFSSISGLFAEGGLFGAGGAIASASAPVLALGAALSALAIGLGITFAKNEDVRKSFSNAASVIGQNLKPLLEVVTKEILPSLQGAWNRLLEILKPLGTFLSGMFVSVWQDMINPALMYLGESILPILTTTLSNLWNGVLVPLATLIGNVLAPVIQVIADLLTLLWQYIIVPFAEFLGSVFGTALESLGLITNETIIPGISSVMENINYLWKEFIEPFLSMLNKNFMPVVKDVFKMLKDNIDSLKTVLNGIITFITGVFTGNWEKAWSGVKDVFRGVFNGIIGIFEGVLNFIIDGLNGFLLSFSGVVNDLGEVIGIDVQIPSIPRISLPRYSTGGFPEDGLFLANHNELVGQFSNGRTAVANNEQIIEGIKRGVSEANTEEIHLLRQQNELLMQLLEKDMSVNIGDREIARANIRGQRSLGYSLVT